MKAPRIILYPYKMGSESARLLQIALKARGRRCLRVRADGNYKHRATDFVVDWGNEHTPSKWLNGQTLISDKTRWLNPLSTIQVARNKLLTFDKLKQHGVSIPDYTEDRESAKDLFASGQWPVVLARHSLTGQAGAGIEIEDDAYQSQQNFPVAPLYVKYMKKKAEYRVHVVIGGKVIDVQQKKKKAGWTGERDSRIRNLANGYVFCRDNIIVPEAVKAEAIKAVGALMLDFGAVDVIWNEKNQKAYVLEVNTAPGLEGATVDRYADYINDEFKKTWGMV